MTKVGTTGDQFDSLVKKLPFNKRNYDISQPSIDFYMTIAFMNTSFALSVDPIVQSISVDVISEFFRSDLSSEPAVEFPDENPDMKRSEQEAQVSNRQLLPASCPTPVPGAREQPRLFLQRDAPNHLQYVKP